MTAAPDRERSTTAYAAVRERCRQIGLPTWRFDSGEALVEEPAEPGLAGLWLRSSEINRRVIAAARAWSGPGPVEVLQLFRGCWLAPLPEERRSRRIGMTAAMALGEEALQSPEFMAACASAQLEPVACRSALKRIARLDEPSVRAAASMLRWMAQDLSALAEYQEAVNGFTTELTQSYETISLLYSLGHGMRDLDQPERFISLVCDRIHETMPYAWLTAVFVDDERVCGPLASRRVTRGTSPVPPALIDRLVAEAPQRTQNRLNAFLVNTEGEFENESQVLVQPVTRDDRLAGALLTGDKLGEDPQLSSYDMQLLEAAAAYIGAFIDNAGLYADQQRTLLGSLKALTASIDAKDRYTRGHSERVAHLAAALARAVGMDERQVERVHICGLLHDVGKIGVPEAVLTKPGRLTDAEFGLVKLHPELGFGILKDIPQLQDILPGVLHHHERWDGRGYPRGLAAAAIPTIARIICLADTFDAMSSSRSYRAAVPRSQVLAEIQRCSGSQFDPQLVGPFLTLDLSGYDALAARHSKEHGLASATEPVSPAPTPRQVAA